MNPEAVRAGDLKRRFLQLMIGQVLALGVAVLALVGYFAFHIGACLPLFAVILVAAAAGQVAFILAFRRG